MEKKEILENKELERKLKTIYTSLNSLIKDDADNNKFSYVESELPTLNHKAVNQRIASNRLKKINNLILLSNHWEEFKVLYKDDVIIKKIGVEFLENKFEINDNIIKTIKEYPQKNEVLYYFDKNKEKEVSHITTEKYEEIKNKILPDIKDQSLIHLKQKKELIKSLNEIIKDNSSKKLDYLYNLSEGKMSSGKINVNWSDITGHILQNLKEGNFIAQQKDNNIVIELPISGIKKENGIEIKSNTIMTIDLLNPKDFLLEVGTLNKPKMNIEDRIKSIRERSIGTTLNNNSLKM